MACRRHNHGEYQRPSRAWWGRCRGFFMAYTVPWGRKSGGSFPIRTSSATSGVASSEMNNVSEEAIANVIPVSRRDNRFQRWRGRRFRAVSCVNFAGARHRSYQLSEGAREAGAASKTAKVPAARCFSGPAPQVSTPAGSEGLVQGARDQRSS